MNLGITEIRVVISGSEQHSLMTAMQARLLYGNISNIRNIYAKSTPLKKQNITHTWSLPLMVKALLFLLQLVHF